MATPEKAPERGPRWSGLFRVQAKKSEAELARLQAENVRTDERVDGFARDHIQSQKIQLRIAAVLIVFLIGVIVVLAGHSLGFKVGADGLTFDGGTEQSD